MTNPQKLPSGKWRIRIYLGKENGKRKYQSITGITKTEVKRKAQEIEDLLKEGSSLFNLSVGTAIDRYIELKSNILSPSTIRCYKIIRRNNLQNLMDIPVINLTNEKIQQAINIESINHAPKTVDNMHGLLSATLKIYRPNFVLRTTLPKKVKQTRYIPTSEDIARLLKITRDTDIYIPILLASMLSLRRSEVCGLSWNDVDLQKGKITICHAKVKNDKNEYVIKNPKTYTSYRTLTVPPIIIEALKNQADKKGFVVKITPAALSRKFDIAITKYGFKHFSFHALRHYNASVMLALNLPDKYAMERGGWATPNIMKSVYQHTFLSEANKYDEILIDYFNKLTAQTGDTKGDTNPAL